MAVAAHAFFVADRLGESLPERDSDVFDRVVGIYVQVAARFDLEIENAVPRNLIEHVV